MFTCAPCFDTLVIYVLSDQKSTSHINTKTISKLTILIYCALESTDDASQIDFSCLFISL